MMNTSNLVHFTLVTLLICLICPLNAQYFDSDFQWNPISTEQRTPRSNFQGKGNLWPILNNRAATSGYENANRRSREELVHQRKGDIYQKARPWDNVIERNLGDLLRRNGNEPRRSARQLTSQQFQNLRRQRPSFSQRVRGNNNPRFNGFPQPINRRQNGRNQFREFPGNRNNQVGRFLGSNTNQQNDFSQNNRNNFFLEQENQRLANNQNFFSGNFENSPEIFDEVNLGNPRTTENIQDETVFIGTPTTEKITQSTTRPSANTALSKSSQLERQPKVLKSPKLLTDISPVIKPDDHMIAPLDDDASFDEDLFEEDFSLDIDPETSRQPRKDNVQPRRSRQQLFSQDDSNVDDILEDTIFRNQDSPRGPREFIDGDHHDSNHHDQLSQPSNDNNVISTSGRRGRNRNRLFRRPLNQGLNPPVAVQRRGRFNDNNNALLVTPRNNQNNIQGQRLQQTISNQPLQFSNSPPNSQQSTFSFQENRQGRDGHDNGYSAPEDNTYTAPIPAVEPPQEEYGAAAGPPIGIKKFTGMDSNFQDKFTVMYAGENDINVMFEGEPRTVCDEDVTVLKGSYDYVGPDGNTYKVEWYADETGFHPTLDHLPVLPIPDHPEVKAAVEAQLAAAAALGPPPPVGPPPCPPKGGDQPSYSAPLPDYSKKV